LGTISRYNNLAGTRSISTTSYTYDAIDRNHESAASSGRRHEYLELQYTYDAASRLQTEKNPPQPVSKTGSGAGNAGVAPGGGLNGQVGSAKGGGVETIVVDPHENPPPVELDPYHPEFSDV
jgi:hypothetical protein